MTLHCVKTKSVLVTKGLEDGLTGSVAETVARVLRRCLENMPNGDLPFFKHILHLYDSILCILIVKMVKYQKESG